jgi:DNA mismatch repair ATPase MutS
MIESLDEIKGVGVKVKNQLISYFGSESKALDSMDNQEFERLVEAGIPTQKTLEIVRYISSKKLGFSYSQIMRTKEANNIFNRIFELLKTYPKTDFGKIGVGLFYPTLDIGELKRRNKFLKDCLALFKSLKEHTKELKTLLADITPLTVSESHLSDLVALEDRKLYEKLAEVLGKMSNLFLVETLEDLEYLRDFDFVRYVNRNSRYADKALELPNLELVYDDDLEYIVPELVISFFGANRESILSAIKIGGLSGDQELNKVTKNLEPDMGLINSTLPEGLIDENHDALENLSLAKKNLEIVAQEILGDANDDLSEKISQMSLAGKEVLTMLKSAQTRTLISSLPDDFNRLISATARDYENKAAQKLGIDVGLINGIFSTDSYPLEIDFERLEEIKHYVSRELKQVEFKTKQDVANQLSKHIPEVKNLIRKTMELDLQIALGEFAHDYKLIQPEIQKELGIGFRGGRNLFLDGKVQPIDYVIGKCDLFPGKEERAVVLTGANSGGKTTLLELIAQSAILMHMGLGAPGESLRSSLFNEVYYFGKALGNDAGAFETLLKTFEDLSKISGGSRIILADEIEAITEPGAAAKILASLLDWFKEDENTLILMVTHLGDDIKDHVGKGVRLDGIEASGLDEKLNLIVDRNPILDKVAKSTPELIVEKLSKTSSSKKFYSKILESFKK